MILETILKDINLRAEYHFRKTRSGRRESRIERVATQIFKSIHEEEKERVYRALKYSKDPDLDAKIKALLVVQVEAAVKDVPTPVSSEKEILAGLPSLGKGR